MKKIIFGLIATLAISFAGNAQVATKKMDITASSVLGSHNIKAGGCSGDTGICIPTTTEPTYPTTNPSIIYSV